MALRGAASAFAGRQRIPQSLRSLPQCIARKRFQFHHSSRPPLQKPTLFPNSRIGWNYHVRAIQGATVDPIASNKGKEVEEESPQNWKIKMLYDGECPLCMREVNMLRDRNKEYGTIKFVDISSNAYSPEEHQGLDYKTVMGRIHAILSDGTIVKDVEAFRRLYKQVGLGWVYAITKYEPIATMADAVYAFWAKYRLQVTGRPPLEEVLEARRKNKAEGCNENNTCKM